MIYDIHSHLLPWVDDGSPSMEDSVQLVRDQIEDGITKIIFTPHYRLDWFHESKERLTVVYGEMLEALDKEGISIPTSLAMEAHDDPQMLREVVEGRVLTLSDNGHFLLELDWRNHNENIVNDVEEYIRNGFTPVIVHYERFLYKSMDEVLGMRDAGALFQVNAYSLLAAESENNRDFAMRMINDGVADFIATDYHLGKFRKTVEAYSLVAERFGEAKRDALFRDNAEKLFG